MNILVGGRADFGLDETQCTDHHQNQQVTRAPKIITAAETSNWTSNTLYFVPHLFFSGLWDSGFQMKCKICFHLKRGLWTIEQQPREDASNVVSGSEVDWYYECRSCSPFPGNTCACVTAPDASTLTSVNSLEQPAYSAATFCGLWRVLMIVICTAIKLAHFPVIAVVFTELGERYVVFILVIYSDWKLHI